MTNLKKKYLKLINSLHEKEGTPPTFGKIREALEVPFEKRSAVSKFIQRLEDEGYLHRGEYLNGSARLVWLSEKGRDAIK